MESTGSPALMGVVLAILKFNMSRHAKCTLLSYQWLLMLCIHILCGR